MEHAEAGTAVDTDSNSRQLTLRYRGTCRGCATKLEPGQAAWYDTDTKAVTCLHCGPAHAHAHAPVPAAPAPRPRNPVGGSSALRMAQATANQRWQRGAIGEYLMEAHLRRELRPGVVILTDRRVPRSRGNVDHVVVAPSGVWVVDAKHWEGRIELRNVGGLTEDNLRLFVDGWDRSVTTEQIYGQVIPVAELIEDRSIPIHPAVVFVDGQWGSKATLRMLTKKPYQLRGVWITWPKALSAMINAEGPLSPDIVMKVGRTLDAHLELM